MVGPAEVLETRGVHPHQIADWLALVGDTADNIPGVKGIGDKTAIQLLTEYGSLDGIYQNLENIAKAGLRKNLEEGRESARLSKSLTVLRDDLDLGFSLEAIALKWEARPRGGRPLLGSKREISGSRSSGPFGGTTEAGSCACPHASRGPASRSQGTFCGPPPAGPAVLAGDYQTVTTLAALDSWIAKVRAAGGCPLSILKPTPLDTFSARIVGISAPRARRESRPTFPSFARNQIPSKPPSCCRPRKFWPGSSRFSKIPPS